MTTDTPRVDANLDPPRWIKARRSDIAYACVEVMNAGAHRYVRDSKEAPNGPVLRLDEQEWESFRESLIAISAAGQQHESRCATVGDIHVTVRVDGDFLITGFTPTEPPVLAHLQFNPTEHECFLDGLHHGEFG